MSILKLEYAFVDKAQGTIAREVYGMPPDVMRNHYRMKRRQLQQHPMVSEWQIRLVNVLTGRTLFQDEGLNRPCSRSGKGYHRSDRLPVQQGGGA